MNRSYHSICYQDAQFTVPPSFTFRREISATHAGQEAILVYTHNSTGMEFVLVPGGCCEIGCNTGTMNERPGHIVQVSPFLLARYPVTLGTWRKVMRKAIVDAPFSPERVAVSRLSDMHPVADISWSQCHDFCERTGLDFPSEAEWEYACRAGHASWDSCQLDQSAWFAENSRDIQPVGLKSPNAFGLYDMLGNVWEYCADTWHDTYAGAPADGTRWVNATSVYRVARGGSVEYQANNCTPYIRLPCLFDGGGGCEGLRPKASLFITTDVGRPTPTPPLVIPDGFRTTGVRRNHFNGVDYELEWITHISSGVELPLLPGAVYIAESFPELWQILGILFSEDVIVTESGASHPKLLNSLLTFGDQLYPALVKEFLTGSRETRISAAFWHAELSKKRCEWDDVVPNSFPSAEVFVAALKETDSDIRAFSAATFGGFLEHSVPHLERLTRLLDDPTCCELVLETIGELGGLANATLPEVLLVAMHHDNQKVRRGAIQSIEKMSKYGFGPMPKSVRDEAIPRLLALIDSAEPSCRTIAVRCLGLLGTKDEVQAALSKRLADSDATVAATARWALDQIT